MRRLQRDGSRAAARWRHAACGCPRHPLQLHPSKRTSLCNPLAWAADSLAIKSWNWVMSVLDLTYTGSCSL